MEGVLILTRMPKAVGEAGPARTLRRALHAAAIALDRMLPPAPFDREADLPPEWFKFPPI
jgi:hypothetical protein